MGKKKKTLKQKRLAELHRLKEFQEGSSSVSTSQINDIPQATQPRFSYSFSSIEQKEKMVITYSLQHDLRKTIIISSIILAFLILLRVLLQSNAFVLPLVSIRY